MENLQYIVIFVTNSALNDFIKIILNHKLTLTILVKDNKKNMQFNCDFFDTDVKYVSRNICLKSPQHRKCLREKYFSNNPNLFEVDKILSDYIERYNKKFDLYLVNCEFKLELNDNFNPHIKRECFYNTKIISMKKYLLYWIEFFMSRGYKFFKINQMTINIIGDRCNMTYEYYINQPMSMCQRKINMNIAKNPLLKNSLDRKQNHPLIRKFSHTPFNNK